MDHNLNSWIRKREAEKRVAIEASKALATTVPGLQDALYESCCKLADKTVDWNFLKNYGAPTWGSSALTATGKKFGLTLGELQHTPLTPVQNEGLSKRKAVLVDKLTADMRLIEGGDVYEQLCALAKKYGDRNMYPQMIFAYMAMQPDRFADRPALTPYTEISTIIVGVTKANEWVDDPRSTGVALQKYFEQVHGYYVRGETLYYAASPQLNADRTATATIRKLHMERKSAALPRPEIKAVVIPPHLLLQKGPNDAAAEFAAVTKTNADGFSTPDTLMRPAFKPDRPAKDRTPGDDND